MQSEEIADLKLLGFAIKPGQRKRRSVLVRCRKALDLVLAARKPGLRVARWGGRR